MCENRYDIRWLFVAISCTAATLILTHLPQEAIPSVLRESGLDWHEHVLAYGLIMLLFLIALKTSPTLIGIVRLFLVIAVIGAVDELTQGFVNRTPSIADFAANIVGMLVVMSFYMVRSIAGRRSSRWPFYPRRSL